MGKGTNKGIVIAIVAALIVIAVMVAAITYIIREERYGQTQAADGVQQSPEAGTGEIDPAIFEQIENNTPEEETVATRPSGWYGLYESSGEPEHETGLESASAECDDVYAWIEIPGGGIDYPIAYCENAEEPFYFTHDIHGNPDDKGMIITDSMNSDDFSDPLTLIYGHNPEDGTMFAGLHRFRDSDFFEENQCINIYLSDAELKYRIYACFTGSADNMLLAYDFNDPAQFGEFFEGLEDIRDLSANFREEARPSFGDHVIGLVTHCDDENKRLFVYGVLDEVRY